MPCLYQYNCHNHNVKTSNLGVSTRDDRKRTIPTENPTFIIHNDELFQKIKDDIINNPMKWTDDKFYE